jgi:phosphoribosyl 1,2-cyclic phosphodiesterase
MARFCPLFSGSSGNCTYIGTSNGGILIDVGVSARRIEIALRERDIDPNSIEAIFITHEHSDHTSGLRVLTKKFGFKVYASEGTLCELESSGVLIHCKDYGVINANGIAMSDMLVNGFHTSHDSRESMGFRVSTGDGRILSVVTDTGCMTAEVRESLKGSDLVLIESNHDVEMLKKSDYPYFLKRRILCDTGHLSNECCAAELPGLAKSGVTRFILGHLSRENNLPELAYNTSLSALRSVGLKENRDFILSVAPRSATDPVMIL